MNKILVVTLLAVLFSLVLTKMPPIEPRSRLANTPGYAKIGRFVIFNHPDLLNIPVTKPLTQVVASTSLSPTRRIQQHTMSGLGGLDGDYHLRRKTEMILRE